MTAPAGLLLLDVSSLQGAIDYQAVAAWRSPDGRKIEGVIARATNGTDPDSRFSANRAGARAAGLRFGAYGVVYPGGDIEAEALAFCRVYSPAPDDLPPSCDWEVHGRCEHDAAVLWCSFVDTVTGRTSTIYTGIGYTSAVAWPKDSPLTKHPLWVAHYTNAAHPLVPSQWQGRFAEWQYSGDKGERVAGIATDVDRDVFVEDTNGDGRVDAADIAAFVERSKRGEPVRVPPIDEVQRAIGVDADGVFGPKSTAALRAWQSAHGVTPSGRLDLPTILAFAAHAPTEPPPPDTMRSEPDRAESVTAPIQAATLDACKGV